MSDDLVERVALIFARSAEDYVGDTRWIYLSNDEKADHLKKIWRGWESQARLAIATIEAAGYVVVPREPTEAMICAGDESIIEALSDHTCVRREPTPAHGCFVAYANLSKEAGRDRSCPNADHFGAVDAALEKDKANVR